MTPITIEAKAWAYTVEGLQTRIAALEAENTYLKANIRTWIECDVLIPDERLKELLTHRESQCE